MDQSQPRKIQVRIFSKHGEFRRKILPSNSRKWPCHDPASVCSAAKISLNRKVPLEILRNTFLSSYNRRHWEPCESHTGRDFVAWHENPLLYLSLWKRPYILTVMSQYFAVRFLHENMHTPTWFFLTSDKEVSLSILISGSGQCSNDIVHYIDVIMTTMASQITSLTVVYSIVYSGADQTKIKAPRHWPLCGELTGTDEFPAQTVSNAVNVSIWWRHHVSHSIYNAPLRRFECRCFRKMLIW